MKALPQKHNSEFFWYCCNLLVLLLNKKVL